jgi:Domain of unknown function (DUF4387)
MATRRLSELAKTIRSKNAGVDKITFDVIFEGRENYELVKASRALTRESVARLYRIPEARISDFVEFDPALAIKFSILRERPSGSPGDSDIFGARPCSTSKSRSKAPAEQRPRRRAPTTESAMSTARKHASAGKRPGNRRSGHRRLFLSDPLFGSAPPNSYGVMIDLRRQSSYRE